MRLSNPAGRRASGDRAIAAHTEAARRRSPRRVGAVAARAPEAVRASSGLTDTRRQPAAPPEEPERRALCRLCGDYLEENRILDLLTCDACLSQ